MIEPAKPISPNAIAATIAGHPFTLLPQRAAFHHASAALFVADIHLGKSTTFARQGVPIPADLTRQIIERDLARLTSLVQALHVKHVVIAGDLFHARSGCDDLTMSLLHTWRHALKDPHQNLIPVTLVRGNHDRASGDPPASMAIACVSNGCQLDAITLRHEPLTREQIEDHTQPPQGPIIAGHLHPVAMLTSRGHQRGRCPCFWIQSDCQLVLPAFGTFTGGHIQQIAPRDQLFAILPEDQGHVMDITPLAQHAAASHPSARRR
jgi:DNA ligase-associated metallophosphoesterase